jgi:cell pole-organizing protein PopZ
MGQAGAQREPTMEEILASIRRIIENNEPGADGNPIGLGLADGEPADRYDADATAADEVSHDAEAGTSGASAAVAGVESQRSAANDAAGAQPVSLAEVAARARVAPETDHAPIHDQGAEEYAADPAPEVTDAAAEEMREALVSDEPLEAPVQPAAEEAKPVSNEAEEAEHPEPKEAVAAAPETASDALAKAEEPQGGGQLVSLQTGEKVAAAFNELDAAIAAGQQRSFDEIAEEMLRPMLTQWLDDNLPTLVERLVIVIPPPNVTGSLHMGHALNNTLQDILSASSGCRA